MAAPGSIVFANQTEVDALKNTVVASAASVAAAQTAADTAATDANTAKVMATAANSAATTAIATANGAVTSAATAEQAASTSHNEALAAASAAASAATTAGTAQTLATTAKTTADAAAAAAAANAKPSGGWAKTDLASGVQASLGKADTAMQPGDATSTVPSGGWAETSLAAPVQTKLNQIGSAPAVDNLLGLYQYTPQTGVPAEAAFNVNMRKTGLDYSQFKVVPGCVFRVPTDFTAISSSSNVVADNTNTVLPGGPSVEGVQPPDTAVKLIAPNLVMTTAQKNLTTTINLQTGMLRFPVRFPMQDRTGLHLCRIEVSSDNFASGNYHAWTINGINEGWVSNAVWQMMSVGPESWSVPGTASGVSGTSGGTGANLSAINSIRFRTRRASGTEAMELSVALIQYSAIPSTQKPWAVLSFDDGYSAHWYVAAHKMIDRGWPGVLYMNIGQQDIMSVKRIRDLVYYHGWQVGTHAYTSATHSSSTTGDAMGQNFARSRAAQRALGVDGGEDFAWWGGEVDTADSNARMRQFFRTARFNMTGSRVTETLPPGDPWRIACYLTNSGSSETTSVPAFIDRVIANKGLGVLCYHNSGGGAVGTGTADIPALQPALTKLDTEVAAGTIQVGTIEQALRPWIRTA